jgi:hypothetical protein
VTNPATNVVSVAPTATTSDIKPVAKVSNAKSNLFSGIKGSDIANIANIAAPIASAFVGYNAANKLQAPKVHTAGYQPFNTKVNVNPQLSASRRAVERGITDNNDNTVSSAARVSRNNAMLNEGAYREAGIYANQQNQEGALRNQEAQLRTGVDLHNMQALNYNSAQTAAINNQKSMLKSQAINSGIAGVAGVGRDYLDRKDNSEYQTKAMSALVAGDSSNSAYKIAAMGGITDQRVLANLYNSAPDDESKKAIYGLLDQRSKRKYKIG